MFMFPSTFLQQLEKKTNMDNFNQKSLLKAQL